MKKPDPGIARAGMGERGVWKERYRFMRYKKMLSAAAALLLALIPAFAGYASVPGAASAAECLAPPASVEAESTPTTVVPVDPSFTLLAESGGAELYMSDYTHALLCYKGEQSLFDWVPTTPRNIKPELRVFDIDGDGADEIAVINNVESGTQTDEWELHVVEYSPSEGLIDYKCDCVKKASKALDCFTSTKGDKKTLTILYGGEGLPVDISGHVTEEKPSLIYASRGENGSYLWDYVGYAIGDDGTITLTLGLAVPVQSRQSPNLWNARGIAVMTGAVIYQEGTFSLQNATLEANADWD